jgi:two-component system chemotaxis response regulator CheY
VAYNILVVEDSPAVQAVISRTLGLAGVDVGELHQAANGQVALDLLGAHWIDLVLTDIHMPVMSGVELIRRMEQDGLLQTIPVVVISSDGSRSRIEEVKAKGVRAYIRKPFTPELLRDVVTSALAPVEGGDGR